MKFETRATWKNDAGNQVGEPLRVYEPESLEQLVEIVREAEKHGVQVRAIGSGHSWSDVTVTSGFLVKPDRLNKAIALDEGLLKEDVASDTLCHVQSGMPIRELNETLVQRELALPNMGGYDAQTFVGAMSTSTHGSGIQFGPLSDFVESIELVSDEGAVYRIEPEQGITDPAKYAAKYPENKLVQEDDCFNAVVVSMGCMGIIYSVILRVQEKFWLTEVRQLSTWDRVKEDLRQGDVFEDNRHYEILVNPYEVDGEYRALITTRNPTTPPGDKPADKLNRNFFTEFIAGLPFIRRILNAVVGALPDITPELINSAMEGLEDDEYSNISYKVFNIGVANEVSAYSAEIGFPVENETYIHAVDRVLELTREYEALGEVHLTSPMSLRFVKGSKAFLSPQYGYDTCMLEIIVVKDTQGSFEMMSRLEDEMYKYSGRPHWGQVNTLTGSHNLVESMYPEYGKWLDVYHTLNKNGTFDSPFSKRVGFRKETFEANS